MKASKRQIQIAGLIVLITLSAFTTFSTPPDGRAQIGDHSGQVKKFRRKRDKEFRDPKQSPLGPAEVAHFRGLSYFKVKPTYRVRARFIRTPAEKKFGMPTSTGATGIYVKYGELRFSLQGRSYKLGAYQSERLSKTEEYKNHLFIPFTDLTSGKETYGGGRYIDFAIPASGHVTLDFNLAYNPSCAYSSRFSCPIPPRENRLSVKIKAGERGYRKSSKAGAAPNK